MTLSLWRFRAALLTLPAGSIAGQRYNSVRCPLAWFLLTETGESHWVDNVCYSSERGVQPQQCLPLWARVFVKLVDATDVRDDQTGLSREVALRLLAQAEAEVAQRELPQWSSQSCCVGLECSGTPCQQRGLYQVHAFLGDTSGPASFIEVNGLLCNQCYERVTIPPRAWWQHLSDERLLAFVGR